VGREKPCGNSVVDKNCKARWEHRAAIGSTQGSGRGWRKLTGVGGGRLSGTEGLNAMADISQRRLQFPTKAIIQSDVRPKFPAILTEEREDGAAHIFRLG